jgi:hypothetical protein
MAIQNQRYGSAIAALAIAKDSSAFDLAPDDMEFLTGEDTWLATDRKRVRRSVEAIAFGAVDIIGLPRFPLPAEFVAAVVVHFVRPRNWLSACSVFEGAEFSDMIVEGRENRLSAHEIFSHCLQIAGGQEVHLDAKDTKVREKVKATA